MITLVSKRKAYAFTAAILAGCISAAAFDVAWNHAGSIVSLLIYATTLPLFLAGLGAGVPAGVAASVAGFLSLIFREPSNYALVYAFMFALPALTLIVLALYRTRKKEGERGWLPEGYLLTVIAIYPCALFLLLVGATSTHDGGLLALTREGLAGTVDAISKADAGMGAKVRDSLPTIARYLPATAGVTWIFVTALGLMLAQKALLQHKLNIRPSMALRAIRMPNLVINVVALCGLGAVFTANPYSYVAANLAIMLGLAFFFVGLAVLHVWAGTKKGGGFVLFFLYVMLFVAPILNLAIGSDINFVKPAFSLALIIATLGVLDQWADFRQRLIKQTKPT